MLATAFKNLWIGDSPHEKLGQNLGTTTLSPMKRFRNYILISVMINNKVL